MKICPNCGLQNPEESRFCNQCGAPIATGTPIAAGAPVAAGAPEESLNRNAAETPGAASTSAGAASIGACTAIFGARIALCGVHAAEEHPVGGCRGPAQIARKKS